MARPRNKPAGRETRQALSDRLARSLSSAMIALVSFIGALSIAGEFAQRSLRFVAVSGDWVQMAGAAASLIAFASGFPTIPTAGGA